MSEENAMPTKDIQTDPLQISHMELAIRAIDEKLAKLREERDTVALITGGKSSLYYNNLIRTLEMMRDQVLNIGFYTGDAREDMIVPPEVIPEGLSEAAE